MCGTFILINYILFNHCSHTIWKMSSNLNLCVGALHFILLLSPCFSSNLHLVLSIMFLLIIIWVNQQHALWLCPNLTSALNIKLLEPLAQGARGFEKLLAPRKIYWPPFFPERCLYSWLIIHNEDKVVRSSLRKNVSTDVEQYIHNGI